MSKLTQEQEKDIIFVAGILGQFMDAKTFDIWEYEKIDKQRERAAVELNKLLDLLAAKGLNDETAQQRLYDKLKRNKYQTICVTGAEATERKNKSNVTLKKEHLDNILEQTFSHCENCQRNKKICGLRKIFKSYPDVIPEFDDKALIKGECEYKQIACKSKGA